MGGVSDGHERQQESYNRDSPKPGKCSSHLHALPGIPFYDGRRNKRDLNMEYALLARENKELQQKLEEKEKAGSRVPT